MNSRWILSAALVAAVVISGCSGANGEAGPRGIQGNQGDAGTGNAGRDLVRGPKNVILIIGDGMQLAHEIAASRYLTGSDAGLVFHDPLKFDWNGYAATWDVTTYNRYATANGAPAFLDATFVPSVGYDVALGGALPYPLQATPSDAYFLTALGGAMPATDSASAATALATGYKTDAGNLAWRSGDPAGGKLTTIAETLRSRFGASIGVVTTVPFSHATPAAFVSHNVSRNNYKPIATEIIRDVKPDVVIGGGWPFDPSHANTSYKYIAQADFDALAAGSTAYSFVQRVPGQPGGSRLLAAATALPPGGKLFGLFGMMTASNDGNFESPIPTGDPVTLVTLATTARENPTLAEATTAALTVLSRNANGFFVMIEQGDIDWANHAGDVPRMFGTVWDLDMAVSTAVAMVDAGTNGMTWDNTLLVVTADHGNDYLRFGAGPALGQGVLPAVNASGNPTNPAQYTLYPGVTYWEHTNELVSVYAKGSTARELFRSRTGTWYPGGHVIDNTHLHDVMSEFLGLR
jgi:alkaline phosphatase